MATKKTYTSVSSAGDCGLAAIAAKLYEHLLDAKRRQDEAYLAQAWVKTLEQAFVRYYDVPAGTSLLDIMASLAPQDFIGRLSYLVRQIGVDQMIAHPKTYQARINGKNDPEGTGVENLRRLSTWTDGRLLAAIADNFNLRLKVQTPRFTYSLGRHENSTTRDTELKLTGGHYTVKLKEPETAAIVSKVNTVAQKPSVVKKQQVTKQEERAISEIVNAQREIFNRVQQNEQALHTTFKPLGHTQLLGLIETWKKHAETNDYLEGRVKYADPLFQYAYMTGTIDSPAAAEAVRLELAHAASVYGEHFPEGKALLQQLRVADSSAASMKALVERNLKAVSCAGKADEADAAFGLQRA